MSTESFMGWRRIVALAVLAMSLAYAAAGAQTTADPHAVHPPNKTNSTAAAGTTAAQDSSSMGGMPMEPAPSADAPMGDDDHADQAANMAAPQPAVGGASMQGSSPMQGMPMGTPPPADAGMGDDDHAAHHPDAAGGMPAAAGASMGGSMGGMMDDMMRGCRGDECGRDRRLNKLLYPQLMALPDLPPERRASVEQLAHHRMHEGIQQLATLSSEASHAVQRNDYAGLQEASDRMRVAWGEFDSGLSAYRALAEGQAPRGIALDWFRREMNLTDPLTTVPAHGVFGLSGSLLHDGAAVGFCLAGCVDVRRPQPAYERGAGHVAHGSTGVSGVLPGTACRRIARPRGTGTCRCFARRRPAGAHACVHHGQLGRQAAGRAHLPGDIPGQDVPPGTRRGDRCPAFRV